MGIHRVICEEYINGDLIRITLQCSYNLEYLLVKLGHILLNSMYTSDFKIKIDARV
jgi:hypothetical protein